MSKIYTKAGDHGDTGYLGAGRIRKDSPRVRALGALDETNSALGVVLATEGLPESIRETIRRIQNDLFEAGAAAASQTPDFAAALLEAETTWLESEIDRLEATIPPLDRFILPGGSAAGAQLHWARTVCRRSEREVVTAFVDEQGREPLLRFVNRLADALFVIARASNHALGRPETTWESRGKSHGTSEEGQT